MDYITDKLKTYLLRMPGSMIRELITKIHFNKNHPENYNIRITDIKSKFAETYDGLDWNLVIKNDALFNLVDDKFIAIGDFIHDFTTFGLSGDTVRCKRDYNYNNYITNFTFTILANALELEKKFIACNSQLKAPRFSMARTFTKNNFEHLLYEEIKTGIETGNYIVKELIVDEREYDDIYNKMHYVDQFTVMGHQNYQADIGCMSASVENRSPFEDVDLFEYMMSIPDEIKMSYGQKGLLRKGHDLLDRESGRHGIEHFVSRGNAAQVIVLQT